MLPLLYMLCACACRAHAWPKACLVVPAMHVVGQQPAVRMLPGSACSRFKSNSCNLQALEKGGVPVSVRITRGLEAAAACGQLRNDHQKQPLVSFSQPA